MVGKVTDSIHKCKIKKFLRSTGLDQSTVAGGGSDIIATLSWGLPLNEYAEGMLYERGSFVSWTAMPRAVSYTSSLSLPLLGLIGN